MPRPGYGVPAQDQETVSVNRPPNARRGPAKRQRSRVTARGLAIEVLVEVDRGARANVVLPEKLARTSLEARDRAFATELAYGATRMRRSCDWLVSRYLRRDGKVDPRVLAAMHVGAYQLCFLGTPAHAAVGATVDEVNGPARSMVNAVLRRLADSLARGPVVWPDEATRLSYPDWMVELLARDLGKDAAFAALEQMNEPASVTRRSDGYIQDRASQMVATHVAARPGEIVADLCAAPGGKATALAAAGAFVAALDLEPSRVNLLAENAGGLGLSSGAGDRTAAGAQAAAVGAQAAAAGASAPPGLGAVVGDAAHPPLAPGRFDAVLVDAPCSGLGVLRRRPDSRWRVRPDDIDRLAGLQRRLLASASDLVAPGGRLYYSVCTLSRAETAGVDRWLAKELAGWAPIAPPASPWKPAGRGALLLPQAEGTDGMFVVGVRRPS